MRSTVVGLLVAALCLSWDRPGTAQLVPDHLRCHKVKDTQVKAVYTADLDGLVAEPGCSIKVPGVLFCTATTQRNVTPQPPVSFRDDAGAAGRFLCYKVKCPKTAVPDIPWSDQFAARTLTVKEKGDLVCAPGRILGPPAPCDTQGESCGSCGSGRCTSHCGVFENPFVCVNDVPPGFFCADDTDCPPEAPICGTAAGSGIDFACEVATCAAPCP